MQMRINFLFDSLCLKTYIQTFKVCIGVTQLHSYEKNMKQRPFWTPSWITENAQGGFMRTFSMLFQTYSRTYPAKISLLPEMSMLKLMLLAYLPCSPQHESCSLYRWQSLGKDFHLSLCADIPLLQNFYSYYPLIFMIYPYLHIIYTVFDPHGNLAHFGCKLRLKNKNGFWNINRHPPYEHSRTSTALQGLTRL